MKKKKILLLGYKKNQIANFLRKKNIVVIEYGQKKITLKTLTFFLLILFINLFSKSIFSNIKLKKNFKVFS